MKNIITIIRTKDNARRIYALPEEAVVAKGTLVKVETHYSDEQLIGIAATDNILMDENQIKAVRVTLGLREVGEFLKVLAVYSEPQELEYPEPETEQEAEPETEPEAEPETEEEQ